MLNILSLAPAHSASSVTTAAPCSFMDYRTTAQWQRNAFIVLRRVVYLLARTIGTSRYSMNANDMPFLKPCGFTNLDNGEPYRTNNLKYVAEPVAELGNGVVIGTYLEE